MQLHLNADELNLLADTLLERVGTMSAQKPSAAGGRESADLCQAVRRYDVLLD